MFGISKEKKASIRKVFEENSDLTVRVEFGMSHLEGIPQYKENTYWAALTVYSYPDKNWMGEVFFTENSEIDIRDNQIVVRA